jgi:hypothetical protein
MNRETDITNICWCYGKCNCEILPACSKYKNLW